MVPVENVGEKYINPSVKHLNLLSIKLNIATYIISYKIQIKQFSSGVCISIEAVTKEPRRRNKGF